MSEDTPRTTATIDDRTPLRIGAADPDLVAKLDLAPHDAPFVREYVGSLADLPAVSFAIHWTPSAEVVRLHAVRIAFDIAVLRATVGLRERQRANRKRRRR